MSRLTKEINELNGIWKAATLFSGASSSSSNSSLYSLNLGANVVAISFWRSPNCSGVGFGIIFPNLSAIDQRTWL